jgi:hypothetical protein
MAKNIIDNLLNSDEPSVRFKVLVNVLGRKLESAEIKKIQDEIKSSPRVKLLLSERRRDGKIPFHPYRKWYGAHWVLATLADIGYPSGDKSLIPLREQVLAWFFSEEHRKHIKTIDGRTRRCASQEGNALFSLLTLGLTDARTEELAERLIKWQWPDGGWNCDRDPKAVNSSFWESLIPLRALALHARLTGKKESREAAKRAAEVFLKRKCYKRQKDGRIMVDDFVELHYPCYWRYDILFGLKVMAEAGLIGDKRCYDALELLESKRLPDGGFPSEGKYYRVTDKKTTGRSLVDWGGTGKKHMNEFVTADALYVLKKAGRGYRSN